MQPQRFDYLDSVRGLAAFTVLLFHLNDVKGEGSSSAEWSQIHNAVFNGHHATSLFFVLSGLVLSYKYLKTPELALNYKRFVIKRMYRLYPAYWVFLLVFYVAHHKQHAFAKIEAAMVFIQEAMLLRNKNEIFTGSWTLNIEMAVSLLMPIFILVMRHNRKWFWYLTVFSLILSAYYSLYVFHFCLGIWLATDFEAIKNGKYKTHFLYRYRYYLLPIAFLCFSGNEIFAAYQNTDAFRIIQNFTGFDWHQLSGFVSFLGLIWIISSDKWQRFLQLKPLLFLGKISYSVYLVQWLVIFICINPYFSFFKNLFQTEFLTTRLIMAVLVIGFTLLLATLLYYFVELPFINLGRKKLGTDDVIIPRHNHVE